MKKAFDFLGLALLGLLLYAQAQAHSGIQVRSGLLTSSQPTVVSSAHHSSYVVTGKPMVSTSFINRVLAAYDSPASGKGQTLYDLGVKYDIDPAYALAFFLHESRFGTSRE